MMVVAGGTERLVVEAGLGGCFLELLTEAVQGAQVLRGGGEVSAACMEVLLVAVVDQVGDFLAEEHAGMVHELAGSTVIRGAEDGGAAVFGYVELICNVRHRGDIKLKTTKSIENFGVGNLLDFPGHDACEPVLKFGRCTTGSYTEARGDRLFSISHKKAGTAILPMSTLTKTQKLGTPLLERIGKTPLVRLERLTANLPGIQILGKAEWVNPGGSVKDRPASAIVLDAQKRGLLGDGKHLLDATSGNTGIAYAMLGAAMDFPVTLCMPSNVSPERKRILSAYGAEIVWTDPNDSSDGAIRKARELAANEPDKYYYADQYNNENNWRAHYRTTANEIWEQTEGQVTHFLAGMGTSGTFTGTSRRLRELKPEIECISMQPDSPFHGLEGMKHMPTSLVPGIYDSGLADRNIEMETEAAYAMAKRLARTEGLLVGVSSAANVAAAVKVGEELAVLGEEAVIVTILCDSADKYLSERFWEEPC